jgi:hypothetical protein
MFRSVFQDHLQGSSFALSAYYASAARVIYLYWYVVVCPLYLYPVFVICLYLYVVVCPLFVFVSSVPACVLSSRAKHGQHTGSFFLVSEFCCAKKAQQIRNNESPILICRIYAVSRCLCYHELLLGALGWWRARHLAVVIWTFRRSLVSDWITFPTVWSTACYETRPSLQSRQKSNFLPLMMTMMMMKILRQISDLSGSAV